MSVDPTLATWLKSPNASVKLDDGAVAAAWGDVATESEVISPLAERAAALAEGARQMAFFSAPTATDILRVPGKRVDLIGRRIDASHDRGGAPGARALVLGAEELPEIDATDLTILMRLA